jgi:hypothetical protein
VAEPLQQLVDKTIALKRKAEMKAEMRAEAAVAKAAARKASTAGGVAKAAAAANATTESTVVKRPRHVWRAEQIEFLEVQYGVSPTSARERVLAMCNSPEGKSVGLGAEFLTQVQTWFKNNKAKKSKASKCV